MQLPRHSLFNLIEECPFVLVDGRFYSGDEYNNEYAFLKNKKKIDKGYKLFLEKEVMKLKESLSLECLERLSRSNNEKELANKGIFISDMFNSLKKILDGNYLFLNGKVYELKKSNKEPKINSVIIEGKHFMPRESKTFSKLEEDYFEVLKSEIKINSERIKNNIKKSFKKVDNVLEEIVEHYVKDIKNKKFKFFIFTDKPLSNFKTDEVIDHLSNFYNKNFSFVNGGNIFEFMLKTINDSSFKDKILSLMLRARRSPDKKGSISLEELIKSNPLSDVDYDADNFDIGIAKLMNILKNKKIFNNLKSNEINDYVVFTGRKIISPDKEGKMHYRAFYGKVLSTSGMHYGPSWGEVNDSKLTDFGKVLAVNMISFVYLNIPRHNSKYSDSPQSLMFCIPPELGKKIKSATHKTYFGKELYYLDYVDLIKESLHPKANLLNQQKVDYLLSERCIFYDAHTEEEVNYNNLSGRICLFHKKVMERIRE